MEERKYGLIADIPDQRDRLFGAPHVVIKLNVDLRPFCLNIYDQGNSSSCTGHGIVESFETLRALKNLPNEQFSRLQVYYDERAVEGNVSSDSGAMIRDGIKNLVDIGVGHENLWPFDLTKMYDKPTNTVYEDASKNKVLAYQRIVNVAGAKAALSLNFPIVAGISVYESFESDDVAKTGIVPLPSFDEKCLGGHCILIVGYDGKGKFICQNSWGSAWGDKGFFYLDEAYVGNDNLTSDLWVIETTTSQG